MDPADAAAKSSKSAHLWLADAGLALACSVDLMRVCGAEDDQAAIVSVGGATPVGLPRPCRVDWVNVLISVRTEVVDGGMAQGSRRAYKSPTVGWT